MNACNLLAVALLATTAPLALASHPRDASAPAAVNMQRAVELAELATVDLNASGAQGVVLARAGQNLGWAHREGLAPDRGRRVVHKFNPCKQCVSARANPYRQGLGEFFLDDPYRHEPAIALGAQVWLQFKGDAPTALCLSPMKRLGGYKTVAHLAVDEHSDDKRYSGCIEAVSAVNAVTADSLFSWLERGGQAGPVQGVR